MYDILLPPRKRLTALLLLPGLLACGCASMSNTDRGVVGGGVLGGATGAIVGSAVRHPVAGALIGAGVGAVSGGLIGNAVDKSEAKAEAQAVAAQQARAQIGMTEVVQLAQQHISDDIIIGQIRGSGSVYNLSAQDIVWLKQNGLSDVVIREMQATIYRYPRQVYTAAPVYVVEPPPPPVAVGIGFGYRCR